MAKFPFYKQLDAMDCGPSCLRMIAKHYGRAYSLQTLRDKSHITREGVSLLGISDAAEAIGFHTMGVKIGFDTLAGEAPLPCIVHWKQVHFVVVYKVKKSFLSRFGKPGKETIFVVDPGYGHLEYTKEEFLKGWYSARAGGEDKGVALLLEPTPDFYKQDDEKLNKAGLGFLFSYLRPYKKFIVQLFLGMILGSFLQLLFPFLTQAIVDFGISNRNLGFVYLVLIAQLVLFISRMSVDFIRNWILLHISSRINISIISDFLAKLMRLPVSFFDIKMTGDLLQRIGDHHRIQSFLTSTSISILFSMVNLVVFSIVMAVYDLKILGVFLLGSGLYFVWVTLFMKQRRILDFKRFAQMADNQGTLVQLIHGMQEIKLNNCERQKRWQWEQIQARLFKINIKSLALNQNQQIGAIFINEIKNIFISFLAAAAVINGSMTLGMMLAVQYIIGQLNSPVEQLTGFMQSMQDAKISLERLGEIHKKDDEEEAGDDKITIIPENKTLFFRNVSFRYEGPNSEFVLRDINLTIEEKKVTALVGTSGSGKTTLVKMALGFYPPEKGEVRIGEINLTHFSARMWRDRCGVVMQDGFIFSDSIAKNIAVNDERIDKLKLLNSVKVANIHEFIESLPLGYNTKIGQEGHGLSQGQKQRILIARAVYKDPEYLFFDEATNALDANNEKVIHENLEHFYKGKTVLVVAHRLSTVKNADKIIVIEKGCIVEQGNHEELVKTKGAYYNLVKNQLELGG